MKVKKVGYFRAVLLNHVLWHLGVPRDPIKGGVECHSLLALLGLQP